MKKVITYGTFDLLHFGHVNVLQNAKKLGDYLIVGITSDDFDKRRGKLNVKQSLSERIDAVKKLGIADEIIVEEYEGQKIDDITKYDVDIFTVG
ncbi:MAG: adenylyltransferase/cytidyltransferase family protein, partial [Clostridia bacterium]|nr:adenylyltransferase/cytidyltransferase family protein [Clostridia bacterium]